MRARLLEATVELLVERGYAGTSTTLVSERAGVSRGAQLHHFPTKKRPRGRRRPARDRGPRRRARGGGGGPADRTAADPRGAADARRPLHLAGLHRRARALGGRPHRPGAAGRGRAAGAEGRPRDAPDDRRSPRRRRVPARRARARAGHPRPGPRARAGQHDHRRPRAAVPGSSTSGPPPSTPRWSGDERARWTACSTTSTPRATSCARPSSGSARTAGCARPRRRAGPSPPRSRTCSGPTRSPSCARAPSKRAAGTTSCWRRSATRWATSTRARSSSPSCPRDEVLDRWAAGRGRPRRGPARDCRPARRCRGSARRCRRPRWRPRGSWRPGRTRSTSYDAAGATTRSDRPDPARRPPRRPHPRLRLLGPRRSEPPAEEFRVDADRAERRACGRGDRRTPRSGSPARRTTSACWSPSGSTATTPTWSRSATDAEHWLDDRPGVRRAARSRSRGDGMT